MNRLRACSVGGSSGGSSATDANVTSYTFNTGSPSAITSYSRTTTNEFYRDSTGKFVNAASNEIRHDHDFDGTPLGMRFDVVSTNKCTNTNWGMTDLTGLTAAGRAGAASISTHPIHGHPTIRIDNTVAGSGTSYVTIDGTTGNTNPHSMRVCCYIEYSGTGGAEGAFIADSVGGLTTTAADCGVGVGEDGFIYLENFTPSSTARKMRLLASNNFIVHFWLNQLEELEVCTFPLKVAGATATRTAASAYINLSAISTYEEDNGTCICEVVFDRVTSAASQYVIQIANGSSTAQTYGLYANNTTYGQIRGRTAISSTSYTGYDVHCPIRGKRFPMATSWQAGHTRTVAGPMTYQDSDAYTGNPIGMTRLNIAGRGTSDPFAGWVRKIHVADRYMTLNEMSAYMFPNDGTTYRGIITSGQSNIHGAHRSTETKQNGGEVAAVAEMDAVYPTSENWLLRGAVDGSAIDYANDSGSGYTNWWYSRATGAFGPRMTYFKEIATAFGIDRIVKIIPHDQGASDAADTVSNFKTSTKAVFDKFVDFLGAETKIVIRPISRRSDAAYDTYDTVKQAQRELVDENSSYIYETPPQDNITLGSDGIHMSNASYAYTMKNTMRKCFSILGLSVSGAVDPPRFTTASRSVTTVTVPITFPSGITALTPTTAIAGFRCFDGDPASGGTEITVTAAAYASGNVTLTLALVPTGTLYVEYARGGLYVEHLAGTIANLAVGNDSNTLGLAWNKIAAT